MEEDEYLLEINELRRRIVKLKLARGPKAVIEELEAQLRILQALYDAAWRLYEYGASHRAAPARFEERSLGDWTFRNVYSYIYEEAVQLDLEGRDLASRITGHDFRASLLSEPSRGAAAQG